MYYGEKFNAITHLVGASLALLGAIILIVFASLEGDPWKVVSVTIYGVSLVLLYSFSTLYHSLRGRAKNILRELDHHSIYMLIAGSYAPLCLVSIRGPWGWSLFGVVCSLAILGVLQELIFKNETRILSVVIYVLMGWAAIIGMFQFLNALGPIGFSWLVAGGFFYTIGIIFYLLDTRLKHSHGIWHLFVIAGSASHYIVILLYVIAPRAA